MYYDYGDNITYDDNGNVDYGYNAVCSASDYYEQAQTLAGTSNFDSQGNFGDSAAPLSAPPDPSSTPSAAAAAEEQKTQSSSKGVVSSGDWKPFGVYSLVQGGQSNSTTIFQIASNKAGLIRGNYYNLLTNETQPIKGAVDKKIMRACWTVGNDKNVVYDTGVANLLKEQSPILIHFNKDKTEQWSLVRLKNPGLSESGAKEKTSGN